MTDRVDRQTRSAMMASVRSKNSRPELLVRSLVHRLGYRYRLHASDLPGSPDIVFRAKRKVIFVHGCFWHRHKGCPKTTMPESRTEFWKTKFEANVLRDLRVEQALKDAKWSVVTIWQCEIKDAEQLAKRLERFLRDPS
ncbi:very short patch repair endonuclease [Granulicella sp. L60]|uniref:very short patch repair endonuclease n=1 Tax=Granulicella sp. L60 TaxID=1641866 RepID=UPI00131A9EB9|nr:very short patch repair endonuclease [Granulicella sp. L60]